MQHREDLQRMVALQIEARGVRDRAVLDALRTVPRREFVPEHQGEFAHADTPLPIGEGQTISQPYIVAFMTEALELGPDDRVLEVGTGSGYAAAVLAKIARSVITIERHPSLADSARAALLRLGYDNVHVIVGDGTKGWPKEAPYDAIVVAAGGPHVPRSLREQLAIGGRLVIPVGEERLQKLVRIRRTGPDRYEEEVLADVRFVPLVGAEGWHGDEPPTRIAPPAPAGLVAEAAERFEDIDGVDLQPLLDRSQGARLMLLGEATHGTSEFYRMRARITRDLIEAGRCAFVALEADWPDAARIDHYVRGLEHEPPEWTAFTRFPTWMWRNHEVRDFVDWLRKHNAARPPHQRVGLFGLDLYSLNTSIRAVLDYLDKVDPETAAVARQRYGCLTPYESDPVVYGRAALTGRYRECEAEVVSMLSDLLRKRSEYLSRDGQRFFDAEQNARLIADAERYYRTMYYGSHLSWNLRDSHMFETLVRLLDYHGPESRAAVWAHNSHLGDASATEMSARGEHNLGQLCREQFGASAYRIGFGTHEGTVAAASDWDAPLEIKNVRPSREGSYERLCHETNLPCFLLPLRPAGRMRTELSRPRLERAIGVIYRPETELQSHYFEAILPRQFDEWIWFDETTAVHALKTQELAGMPDTYPFGL